MPRPKFHNLVDKSEDKFAKWAGTWDIEIAAVTFSCLTLAALVALLIAGNGQTVWSGVTLNTYVSILATASKLSALFALSSAIGQTKWNTFRRQSGSLLEFEAIDLASRGALGCIQLLCLTRKVAFVGALTFILAFAFDPFTQQLVQFKTDEDFRYNTTVSAPVTARYNAGSQLNHPMVVIGTTHENLLDPHMDYAMQSSILSGLVQDQSIVTQQLLVSCPSGNCTWSPMKSLGVCSRCANVESMMKKSIVSGTPLPYLLDGDSPTMMDNFTRFSLPNGLYIDNLDGSPSHLYMTAFGTGLPSDTIEMKAIDTLIWSMSSMKVLNDPRNTSAIWPDLPIQATECALYYCAKEYNMAVEGNQIRQNFTELTSFKRDPGSWRPYKIASDGSKSWVTMTNTTKLDSISWDAGSPVNRTDLSLRYQGQRFNVSFNAVRSISQYFWTNFAQQLEGYTGITGYYLDNGEGPNFAPSILQILYQSRNLENRFNILAHSMSNAIRTSKADTQNAYGNLGRSVTKYRIEWPWIVMPIMIVAATLVQLIVTMRNSRTRPILKSSILAVLSRGPYLHGVFDGAETVRDMRNAATHEKVSLFDMTEPMMSPTHAKKFSIGSSSYMSSYVSSPEVGSGGPRSSPLPQGRIGHWRDDSAAGLLDGSASTRTETSSISHGLGINVDGTSSSLNPSPVFSPRRALRASRYERLSAATDDDQESFLQELQDNCAHFRGDDRGSR